MPIDPAAPTPERATPLPAETDGAAPDPDQVARWFWAVEENNLARVEQMVLDQPALKTATYRGMTVVHQAAMRGTPEGLQTLVDLGLPVDLQDPGVLNGRTALQLAVSMNRDAAVKALLDLGADVNRADRAGQTALHVIAGDGLTGMLALLAAYHPDPGVRDGQGALPQDLATPGILEALVAYGVRYEQKMLRQALAGRATPPSDGDARTDARARRRL